MSFTQAASYLSPCVIHLSWSLDSKTSKSSLRFGTLWSSGCDLNCNTKTTTQLKPSNSTAVAFPEINHDVSWDLFQFITHLKVNIQQKSNQTFYC